MRLAFLGTGAAFSGERYNGAVVVDGRVLLDGGAPLLPHMRRTGVDPGAIDVCFLSHFHGDHLLGLPPFILHRVFVAPRPLTFVGPPGVGERVESLFRFAWGEEWDAMFKTRVEISYREAGAAGEVAGIAYETVALDHGATGCTGYRLRIGGRLLAYSGDTEPTPPLDALVQGAEVAIVEATGPGQVPTHTGWEQALALRARHPQTRFFFNHVYQGELDGAASDLLVVDV